METIKNIALIYHFVKVAKYKSFSEAATHLGVSRSHLSKSVKELENQLGQALLKRNTRIVDFTPFGESYFQKCQTHLEEIEKITKQSRETAEPPQDHIRITVAGAYGEEVVAPRIYKLLKLYPQISCDLVFSTELVDMKKLDFDLAIRVSLKKPTSGHVVQIGSRKEYVCATPNFLNRHGHPKRPSDLADFNCLTGNQKSWSFKKNHKVEHIKIKGNFTSANGRALTSATLNDLGISKLPAIYVLDALRTKKLIPLLTDYTEDEVPIWAIIPSKNKVPLSIKLLLQEFNIVLF